MNRRQKYFYKDRCDIYKTTDRINSPTYKDIPCLLERCGVNKYSNKLGELHFNYDKWYFDASQPIELNWVICLNTKNHPERGHYWLVQEVPKGYGGRINRWEVVAERHLIFPKGFI